VNDAAPLLTTNMIRLNNGKHLRIARLGQGSPIVLLHGYPETLQIWHRLVPLLADRFEVIAFDWPGMGCSDEWPGGATPQIKAKRLLAILDVLAIQQPTIVGLDMGGQPALAFASMYADRISRLVIMNSLVFGDEQTSWELRLLRRFGFNRFALQRLPGLIFRRAERTFLPRGYQLDAQLRNDFQTAFSSLHVRRFISRMCAGYEGTLHQLPDLYRTIDCPTSILWAERDAHFPIVHATRLRQSIADSTLQIIPDGTHWMALTHPASLAELIAAEG